MHSTVGMGVFIFLNALFVVIVVWAVICVGREQKCDGTRKRNEDVKSRGRQSFVEKPAEETGQHGKDATLVNVSRIRSQRNNLKLQARSTDET